MNPPIRWSANSLASLELRDGTFVLIQMLERKGWIAALNFFSPKDDWEGIAPAETDVLFINCALRAFLKRSNVRRVREIPAVKGLRAPDGPTTLLNTNGGFREVKLWPDTNDEITILAPGANGLVGLHTSGVDKHGKIVDRFQPITPSEYKKYERMETSHLGDYPSLNERLLLCRGKGWNFDPLRNLMFDWPLERECSTYAQITSGKIRLDRLGYFG